MAKHDLIVIGASAGGIEALSTLVSGLPADLDAAVLVVVHVAPYTVSFLPEILSRAGPLPAMHAEHGGQIVPGRIVVAPPDHHLLVRNGHLELTRGPRENHTRPAIDPLFRSAARSRGSRVIGVILSGALYDGSMGLLAVKSRGGTAIVQDPAEATVDSMPRSALRHVAADYILPVAEIAALLPMLTWQSTLAEGVNGMIDEEERLTRIVATDFNEQANDQRDGETTIYSCPDCGGVLWQGGEGSGLWFRCHVGHAFGPEVLMVQKAEEVEAALWSSLRLLKEKATLTRQLATRGRESGNGIAAERMDERAQLEEQHAAAILELLHALPGPVTEAVAVSEGGLDDDRG